MGKLAGFILAGYWQAAFFIASFAWFASFIPLVGIFSSAALALITLGWGGQRASVALVLSTLLLLGFFAVASLAGFPVANYQMVLLFVLLQWLPIMAIALLLRQTESLSFTLNMIVVGGVTLILLSALLVPQRTELWGTFFSELMSGLPQDAGINEIDFAEEYRSFLEVMTGAILTSLISVWTVSLLLARWWESLSGVRGSFRAEFTGLSLGKVVGVLGILLFVSVPFAHSPLMRELLMVIAYALFLQGVATIHYLLGTLNNSDPWLFAFYVILVLSPFISHVPIAVSVLGAFENLANFRSRRRIKIERYKE